MSDESKGGGAAEIKAVVAAANAPDCKSAAQKKKLARIALEISLEPPPGPRKTNFLIGVHYP